LFAYIAYATMFQLEWLKITR